MHPDAASACRGASSFAVLKAACYSRKPCLASLAGEIGMPEPKHTPVNLKAPHGAKVMEIQWADGHKSILPHEILRGYCPCAHCQGHYALQFTWGDRHDSGIYTFTYLRSLCQCPECKPNFSLENAP
jgi:hypothetical protein